MIGEAGAYSYSIYLLHFFVVFRLARFIDEHVMSLSNFYVACLWSALCFALTIPFAQACYRWIEAPFLKLRRPYLRPVYSPIGHRTSPTRSDGLLTSRDDDEITGPTRRRKKFEAACPHARNPVSRRTKSWGSPFRAAWPTEAC